MIHSNSLQDVEGADASLAAFHGGIKVYHQQHCVSTFSWAKVSCIRVLFILHPPNFPRKSSWLGIYFTLHIQSIFVDGILCGLEKLFVSSISFLYCRSLLFFPVKVPFQVRKLSFKRKKLLVKLHPDASVRWNWRDCRCSLHSTCSLTYPKGPESMGDREIRWLLRRRAIIPHGVDGEGE